MARRAAPRDQGQRQLGDLVALDHRGDRTSVQPPRAIGGSTDGPLSDEAANTAAIATGGRAIDGAGDPALVPGRREQLVRWHQDDAHTDADTADVDGDAGADGADGVAAWRWA